MTHELPPLQKWTHKAYRIRGRGSDCCEAVSEMVQVASGERGYYDDDDIDPILAAHAQIKAQRDKSRQELDIAAATRDGLSYRLEAVETELAQTKAALAEAVELLATWGDNMLGGKGNVWRKRHHALLAD